MSPHYLWGFWPLVVWQRYLVKPMTNQAISQESGLSVRVMWGCAIVMDKDPPRPPPWPFNTFRLCHEPSLPLGFLAFSGLAEIFGKTNDKSGHIPGKWPLSASHVAVCDSYG